MSTLINFVCYLQNVHQRRFRNYCKLKEGVLISHCDLIVANCEQGSRRDGDKDSRRSPLLSPSLVSTVYFKVVIKGLSSTLWKWQSATLYTYSILILRCVPAVQCSVPSGEYSRVCDIEGNNHNRTDIGGKRDDGHQALGVGGTGV